MKTFLVYSQFYLFTFVSTIFGGFISFFIVVELSMNSLILYNFIFSSDLGPIVLFLIGIPLFIFIFQILQDINYTFIHLSGYWAYDKPKFSHRGITIPQFYQSDTQSEKLKKDIQKSKYRYRFLSVFQWVLAVVIAELGLVVYWYLSNHMQLKLHSSIGFILVFGGMFLSFFLWNKFLKIIHLDIAYIENEREFYYKKSSNQD